MSMIRNYLKNEKPTDGEIEISHQTKPPCLHAVHLGMEHFFRRASLVIKLFQINAVSIVFQRGRGKVYNADKFVKQLGQFVYQNSCHLRQFGWQLIVAINAVKLGLLVINFVVLIAYTKLKNDSFGSATVAVRKTLSRETRAPEKRLNLEKKCLNGAFWMDSKNYWTRIKCFSDRVTLSFQ